MAERVWSKGNSPLLVGMQMGETTMQNSRGVPQKLKIEPPCDPAILLLGIHPDKTIIWKDPCTPMFIRALFTRAKTWKQPKYPSTDGWIKKKWYIQTKIVFSHEKWNNAICSNMDPLCDHYSKQNKSEEDTAWYHLCAESKIWQKWTSIKQKQTYRHREQICGCKGGSVWGRKDWEFGISRGKLLYIRWIHNKVLLYSNGNSI